MKLDIKSILIIALTLMSIIFAWKYFNESDKDYKKELQRLRTENELIQKQRDSLFTQRKKLEGDMLIIRKHNDSLIYISNVLEKEVVNQKHKANLSRQELDKLRSELEETRTKIEEIKKHPSNRSGDELLNSLKSKIKK